ncbi:MAG: Ppx/GppA phosphatase family protein [Pseudomonadota bacterium]|nr:Ppx/GppA phosphatase family protein [Pseudomonadota bacterium]
MGTNNCRLLVARPAEVGFRVIDGFSRVVRLGEGVREAGMLSDTAIERTVEALKICAKKMSRRRVSDARCVATQAARSARNSDYFIERVKDETGIGLEIISSREEAELTLTGCFSLLDPAYERALMFDVGGGSAEFVWARILNNGGAQILGWTSLPYGVVTLMEMHGNRDLEPKEYESLISRVVENLRPFDAEFGISENIAQGSVQMVGTAGTVTTVAGVDMRLPRYNRSRVDGSWLEFDAVERISRALSGQSRDERAAHPCIGHTRADLIVVGCAVLQAVCRLWPAGRLRVADRGVREGILSVMSGQRKAMCDGATAFAAE